MSWKPREEGLERFLGPALISNRLSNGKGAGRLRDHPAAVALTPLLAPRLTLTDPSAGLLRHHHHPLLPTASLPHPPLSRTASLYGQSPPQNAEPSQALLAHSFSAPGLEPICYLSISRSSPEREDRQPSPGRGTACQESGEAGGQGALPSPSAPLITISVPPNTTFVRRDSSVRLCASRSPCCCSSSSDEERSPAVDAAAAAVSDPSRTSSSSTGLTEDSSEPESPLDDCEERVNTAPPPERQWVMTQRLDQNKPVATLSVLCYNVLCDKYASTSLYSYCPVWALNWEYRKKAIVGEVRHYDADVVTLQEVETEQFRVLFQPALADAGYAGIFSPKSRARTMPAEDKKYVDGCAIFWKTDKLSLEREELIEFTQMAIHCAEGSEAMLNRVMTRDNIALAAVLRLKSGVYNFPPTAGHGESVIGLPLVVCTAHVHWDPEFCDVKLVQTMMLVSKVTQLVKEVGAQFNMDPAKVPTLVCGDLNSLPQSGVLEYMTTSRIRKDHEDFKAFRGADDILGKLALSPVGADPDFYHHPLRLDSAYDTAQLPFTNYTLDFKGVIDYIFASPASLYKLGVLGPLDPAWLRQHKILGCPHPHIPSDHIPLWGWASSSRWSSPSPPPLSSASALLESVGRGSCSSLLLSSMASRPNE